MQVKLNKSPLQTGVKYGVTFFVSLADTCKFACNDIGAYFSDSALYSDPLLAVKSNFTPQIANNPVTHPLTDKVNWMRVSGCFTAAGGEQYIVIGNFKDDASSSVDSIGSSASNGKWDEDAESAYYYVDDVSVREIVYAKAGRDTEICESGSAIIGTDTAKGVSYQWQPATGLANPNAAQTSASPTITTTYTLTVRNDSIFGCNCPDSVSTDTVTVFVCPPVILPDNIFIPTAFSPNGDGQNDILYARGHNIAAFHLAIFDRWGNKVFESQSMNQGWDGTYNYKPMETGTYVYYADGSYTDGKTFHQKGNITLVR